MRARDRTPRDERILRAYHDSRATEPGAVCRSGHTHPDAGLRRTPGGQDQRTASVHTLGRVAQPHRRQAERASRGSHRGRPQRRGEAADRRRQHRAQGRPRAGGLEQGARSPGDAAAVRRAGERAHRPGVRLPRRLRQRAPPELPRPGHRPRDAGPDRGSTAPASTRSPSPARTTTRPGWEPDFNKEYYENLYFGEGADVESLKTFYEKQSSGRYSVDGEVSEVTTVPLQRGSLRPQQRLPVRQQRLHQHLDRGRATA